MNMKFCLLSNTIATRRLMIVAMITIECKLCVETWYRWNPIKSVGRNFIGFHRYQVSTDEFSTISSVPGSTRWKTACARAKNKIVSKVEMFGTKLWNSFLRLIATRKQRSFAYSSGFIFVHFLHTHTRKHRRTARSNYMGLIVCLSIKQTKSFWGKEIYLQIAPWQ